MNSSNKIRVHEYVDSFLMSGHVAFITLKCKLLASLLPSLHAQQLKRLEINSMVDEFRCVYAKKGTLKIIVVCKKQISITKYKNILLKLTFFISFITSANCH